MNNLPKIYLVRHGQTEWSLSGQHTGLTDIPLNEKGKNEAAALGKRLQGIKFSAAYYSPLSRARETCKIAGLGELAKADPDLVEWHYGAYEGRTTAEIRHDNPNWYIFRDGCPEGETIAAVGERADRVVARLREAKGDVIIFSHGHFLRFIAASWLEVFPSEARFFMLSTASVSILGYEHNKMNEPVICLWNDNTHTE